MKSVLLIMLGTTLLSSALAVDPPRTHDARGFALPQPGYEFRFPADHGSHPDFAIEWWYVTGHLDSQGDKTRRFGYQLTFFRLAQVPPDPDGQPSINAFQNHTLHLAHFALTDAEGKKFYQEERLNREGWDARAAVGDLNLRNGNWSMKRTGPDQFTLRGTVRSDIVLDLDLTAAKPLVLFGRDGLSRKSADPSAASYYVTYTRFSAQGSLRIEGSEHTVSGSSWMDHEISSSQLGPDQVGWDWVSMQLDDGREIMAYVLRRDDGSFDPFSTLTWIAADSSTSSTSLAEDGFEWQQDGFWSSPTTGARYPIAPAVTTIDPESGKPRTFRMRPILEQQEINGKVTGMAYWEGACDVLDERGEIIGRAYLELAGYSGDLRARLRGE